MAEDRIRPIQGARPIAQAPEQVLRDDAQRRALLNALPEWLRGSKLISGTSFTTGTTVYLEHKLGRPHNGWMKIGPFTDTSETGGVVSPGLMEIPSSHADYLSGYADTHIQLYPWADVFGTVADDMANVPAGSAITENTTVTGARNGDAVTFVVGAGWYDGIVNGFMAVPSAGDLVQHRIYNPTAGAVNPASRTFSYVLHSHNGGVTFTQSIIVW